MAHPLVEYREANGLTQQQLADKLKVSRGLVSLIEIGARSIQWQQARAWESLLGIPKEKLSPDVFGDPPKRGKKVAA